MKYSILLGLITVTLLSCGTDTKPVQQASAPEVDFRSLRTPVPFEGHWVVDDYLQQIADHQSPRKAQENIEECFVYIPGQTLTPTTMVLNFHEGLSDLVMIKQNDAFQLWEKQDDSLTQMKYTIETISADKIKIGDKGFTRVDISKTDGQPRILEEILFKGQYESKNGDKVEFKNNGEVSGLAHYKVYQPVVDYFDAGLQIDQVALGETKEKLTPYGFKFKKDKLELYALKCLTYDDVDKRCVEVAYGDKMYELRKTDSQK